MTALIESTLYEGEEEREGKKKKEKKNINLVAQDVSHVCGGMGWRARDGTSLKKIAFCKIRCLSLGSPWNFETFEIPKDWNAFQLQHLLTAVF